MVNSSLTALIPLLSPNSISQLKEYPPYDDRFAFPSHVQSTSSIIKYYPYQGGISSWVNNMVKTLIDLDVDILTDTSITSIEFDSCQWNIYSRNSLSLPVKYDFLVSTIPFNLFAKYLPDYSISSSPPFLVYLNHQALHRFNAIFYKLILFLIIHFLQVPSGSTIMIFHP